MDNNLHKMECIVVVLFYGEQLERYSYRFNCSSIIEEQFIRLIRCAIMAQEDRENGRFFKNTDRSYLMTDILKEL